MTTGTYPELVIPRTTSITCTMSSTSTSYSEYLIPGTLSSGTCYQVLYRDGQYMAAGSHKAGDSGTGIVISHVLSNDSFYRVHEQNDFRVWLDAFGKHWLFDTCYWY